MPEISVIVPVYQTEAYLRRCVDSIRNQTFSDFELILVDDGSPDNCPAICQEYAERDRRIRVIHQNNQGQAAARNRAVAQANGEWLHFVDSDDMIHPQMLECLYQAAISTGANLSMCGAVEADTVPEGFFLPVSPHYSVHTADEPYFLDLYKNGGKHRFWIVCGKLIRKAIVKAHPFTNGRRFEDNAVVGKWLYEAQFLADTENALYFYQANPFGTAKSGFSYQKLDYLWALEEMMDFYGGIHYDQMQRILLSEAYLLTAPRYYYCVRDELHDKATARSIRKQIRRVVNAKSPHIQLTRQQQESLSGIVYPRPIRDVRYAYSIIRRDGFAAFLKSVFKKVHSGRSI